MRTAIAGFILVFGTVTNLLAQNDTLTWVFNGNDTLIRTVGLYAALSHQHEDFFNTPFSFQGLEAGVIVNDAITAGVFFSSFVSNLQSTIADNPMFITSWNAGLCVGKVYHPKRVLHTGWEVSGAYFSLEAGDQELALISDVQEVYHLSGMVLTPEVYTEANILKWMKFRAGLAYTFYTFGYHEVIKRDDLNSVLLDFSLIVFR